MRFSVFNPFSNFYMPSSNSLHPQLLRSLVSFWLEGCPTECLQQPMDMALIKKWFMPNDNFDHTCRTHYRQPLEEAMRLDDQAVLDLATQGTPDTALGMILLLDQISRNTYRGTEAQKVRSCLPMYRHRSCLPNSKALRPTPSATQKLSVSHGPSFLNRTTWTEAPNVRNLHPFTPPGRLALTLCHSVQSVTI